MPNALILEHPTGESDLVRRIRADYDPKLCHFNISSSLAKLEDPLCKYTASIIIQVTGYPKHLNTRITSIQHHISNTALGSRSLFARFRHSHHGDLTCYPRPSRRQL